MPALTPDQEALVEGVRAFLDNEPEAPAFKNLDQRFSYLVDYQRRLNEARLAVPAWPAELGGRGLDVAEAAVVSRALGLGGAPELINFVGTDVVGPALLRFATPEQLRAWMPKMAAAEEIWCQLFSEPDAGSDLTSLRTRAERVDAGFRVDGQKVWSTWAQYARWGLLLARTGAVEARHRGITAFVIEMDRPGIAVRPLTTMTGSAEFAEVFFDGLLVPEDAVIGDVDGGWAVAQVILNAERGPYAVRRAAVIGAALQRVLAMARTRDLDPTTRDLVARAVTGFRLLELRVDQLVADLTRGAEVGPEAAIIKQLMTTAEQAIFDLSLRLAGGDVLAWSGHSMALLVEAYLYSRAASIYGGHRPDPAQHHRRTVARSSPRAGDLKPT
jgi:alkylation response protein AidB-like acyl-CoA dehydrogenase